jgi:membrane-bound lytic murein transglycosylase B
VADPRLSLRRVLAIAAGGTAAVGLGAMLVTAAAGSGDRSLTLEPTVVPAAPAHDQVPVAARPSAETPVVSSDWVARTATRAAIPAAAVRAYGAATLREARDEPSCHLGWTTLAGLGWVESQHGTIGGRVLGDDGRADRPIFGPALDGTHGTAAIRSVTGGWERAVGPLQFLPSTWARWAADGDGDGTADPQDLDDAALAAGRYLCGAGGDLATGPAWVSAVLAYNHADAYVNAVYVAASTYATRTGAD